MDNKEKKDIKKKRDMCIRIVCWENVCGHVDRKGEHMNEELLTRLVDALEGINNNLSEIAVSLDSLDKNIDGCISVSQNGKSRYLCISGDVYTN